jgi:hypothetical protein
MYIININLAYRYVTTIYIKGPLSLKLIAYKDDLNPLNL